MVMLDTDITTELAAEGMAREIVRRLQMMRRSAGFEIVDHIIVYYQGDEYIKRVIADFTDYNKQETLSEQLVDSAPEEGAYAESFKLEGHELLIGVKKLN
jgi:isoleucyl-tRNA synthetase